MEKQNAATTAAPVERIVSQIFCGMFDLGIDVIQFDDTIGA